MTHICVGKPTITGSDNGLSPGRRHAIIWTNAGILLIGPLGTNFSEMLSEIQTFSLKKIRLKMSSAKCYPFCLGLNELIDIHWLDHCTVTLGTLLTRLIFFMCILTLYHTKLYCPVGIYFIYLFLVLWMLDNSFYLQTPFDEYLFDGKRSCLTWDSFIFVWS